MSKDKEEQAIGAVLLAGLVLLISGWFLTLAMLPMWGRGVLLIGTGIAVLGVGIQLVRKA